ncbi:MAG: glucuronate isomerase [Oscillospiraceae bacterium]|nr:glucuronate isomerase [Oscillospiraceae bacterium]MDD7354785.1 glucuronate isomerase [Oscillospiraceae bacterium]
MKEFMGEDFLLDSNTEKELFAFCKDAPIFDWHCHLSPEEIYRNETPKNITELWLGGDHYKWRAMRCAGINEELITGNAGDYDKFKAWSSVMDMCPGNPLYHWTHLELQRYFNIKKTLSPRTADEIWEETNSQIASGGFKPRELITRSNVVCVCTTDDPADSLEYHKKLREDTSFKCKVLPAFRPDKALYIDQPTFKNYIEKLSSSADKSIETFNDLRDVLLSRIELFDSLGCRATDHALTYMPTLRADEKELDSILKKGINGENVTNEEADKYKTELMLFLAREYYKKGWAMELHLGAMRNNNTLMFNKIGADTGFDSMNDARQAESLSKFLDMLASENSLPKTILFTLNPKDNYVLGSMTGNFQTDEAVSKIQFGSAWWFNDNIDGMREQIKAFANLGVIGGFIGMVTDSRSFLSYPRHEYFRRIFCSFLGSMVERGEYPYEPEILKSIVNNVSFYNAKKYFGVEV